MVMFGILLMLALADVNAVQDLCKMLVLTMLQNSTYRDERIVLRQKDAS